MGQLLPSSKGSRPPVSPVLCDASELVTSVAAPDDNLGIVRPASSSPFGLLPHTEPCRR